MNAIEHAVALPPDEVVVHRATRRKILRNIAPLTTGAQDVHQAVHHRTHVGAALAAARPRWRNERRNNRPLLVREVAWVPQMITIVSRSVFLRPHRQPPANQTASFQSQMIPVTPEVSRRTLSNPCPDVKESFLVGIDPPSFVPSVGFSRAVLEDYLVYRTRVFCSNNRRPSDITTRLDTVPSSFVYS